MIKHAVPSGLSMSMYIIHIMTLQFQQKSEDVNDRAKQWSYPHKQIGGQNFDVRGILLCHFSLKLSNTGKDSQAAMLISVTKSSLI